MSVNCETTLLARARLLDQIDALAGALHRAPRKQLARHIDDIRTTATQYQLAHVAQLARGMEKALAGSLSLMLALPYVEAMRDAVGCERADPHIAEAFLASINLRLYG